MHRLNGHVMAVRKEVEEGRIIPTENVQFDVVNLDNFMLTFPEAKESTELNVGELVRLKEDIDKTLAGIQGVIMLLLEFDKNSPRKVWDSLEKDEETKAYTIRINLHHFMDYINEEGEIEDIHWCDNYYLAKQLLEQYEKAGNDIKGIEDISFREEAMWEIKNKAKAKKFRNFIHKTYIKPALDRAKKDFNIKKVRFEDGQILFDYKK